MWGQTDRQGGIGSREVAEIGQVEMAGSGLRAGRFLESPKSIGNLEDQESLKKLWPNILPKEIKPCQASA